MYPFECEKEKLPSPAELQAAIDGNRREGRRPSYGNPYGFPEGVPGMHPAAFPSLPGAGQMLPNGLRLPNGGMTRSLTLFLMHQPALEDNAKFDRHGRFRTLFTLSSFII